MGAIIEAATTGDRPAIFALLTNNNLPVDGLTDHIDTTIIARLDGLVVGCAALELYLDGALLRSVAVDAASRSVGIGHQLTESALTMAHRFGTPAVYS